MSRDRFEAMGKKVANDYPCNTANTEQLCTDIERLLRREYTSLVRAVKQLKLQSQLKLTAEFPTTRAYRMACDDVLALLAKRKGRTR